MKKKILGLISVLILIAIIVGLNINNKEILNFNATKSQANVETTIQMTNQGLVITANGLIANDNSVTTMKNNTDYLQKCIDQVSEKGGGTVHIPAGTYYFSAQDTIMRNGKEFSQYVIKCKNNVLLEGEGNNENSGTILKPQGETTYGLDMFYYNEYADSKYTKATYLENADFKGFIIDAQGAVGQNYNRSGNGFMINLFMDCEWNNVTVKNTDGTGFAINGSINSTVKNCLAVGCGKKATIEDEGASGFGIGIGYSNKEYIYINNCESNNNKKYGFVFEHQARYGEGNYTATKSDGFVVTDSKASGNKYDFGGKSSYDVLYENCTSGYGEESNTNTVKAYDFKEEKSVRTNIRKANYTTDYTDISELSNKEWINRLSENGITFRFKGTEFWPDTELSRAQALLWLYRYSGRPGEINLSEISSTEKSKTGFSDIDNDETLIKDEELKSAIKWAISETIIDGPSDGNSTFRPDDGITKRELIIMLWKYTGGYVLGDNIKFADCNDDEELQNALDWGIWAEIVERKDDSTEFKPNDVYTRYEGLKWMYLCGNCFSSGYGGDGSVAAWITYHLQGGNTKIENPTSYRNSSVSDNLITLNNPTKEGYTFEGWIGKSYKTDSNGATYCEPLTTLTHDKNEYGNKIYTAIWNPNTYSITFNANGGTGEMEQQYFTYDNPQAILENSLTREGYVFVGWNTTSNGSGTSYTDGQVVKNLTSTANETITLYAQWEQKVVDEKIKYKVEHYKQNIDDDEYTYAEGMELSIKLGETVKIPVMEYEGFTSPEVKTVKITEENQIIKYYYTRNSYKIIVEKGNGIESVTVNPSEKETFKYGSTVRLVAIPKKGYGNGKWSTGEIDKADILIPANDVTVSVYADLKNYNITYNLNGGTVEGNPKTYTVETENIKLKNPTKEGHTFLGWTGSNGETPQKDVTIEKGTIGDLQYTANWSGKIEYKVEHYKQNIENDDYTIAETVPNNGEIGETVTIPVMEYEGFTSPKVKTEELKTDGQVIKYYYTRNSYKVTITKGAGIERVSSNTQYKYGEKVLLQAILKDGYEGAKWTGDYESNEFTMPAKNIQMSVSANLIEYDITYNLNGGTEEENPKTYTIETESITLKNPSRVGYTFLGWTGSNGETPQKDVTIEKGTIGDLQFTANWQVISVEEPNDLEVGISYSTKELTNQDVTVIISANNKIKEVEGWTLSEDGKSILKIYEQNGSETVTIIDEYGNEKEQFVEVNNIDKIPPEVEITYEKKDGYVIATAKTNEKVREVDGWELSEDKQTLTKIYYENKEEKVIYTDLAGNETEKLVKIDSIKDDNEENNNNNNNNKDDDNNNNNNNNGNGDEDKGQVDSTGGNKNDSTTSDKQLPAAGMKFVIWTAIGCIGICTFLFIKVKKYKDI